MRNWFIVILFIFVYQSKGHTQQPAYFLFGQDQFEGIDIYNIIQDFEDNYWFATDQGLYVHDGYSFKKVGSDKMKASSVFNFVIDSKGVIYCCNLSQQVFKIEQGACSLIFDIPDTGMDIQLVVNKKDELYISTSKNSYVLNRQHKLIHRIEYPGNVMLGPPFLMENGKVIQHVSNQSKLLIYERGASYFENISSFEVNEKQRDNLLHFFKLGKFTYGVNNLSKEIYKVNQSNYSIEKTERKIETETNLLRYYALDQTLWVSNSIAGVFLLDDQLKRRHLGGNVFKDYFISYVYKDREGNMLLATFDQGIIVVPDFEIQDVLPAFSEYKVTRITKGAENELLFGLSDGGLLKHDGKLSRLSSSSNKSVENLFYWPKHQLIFDDTKNLTVLFPNKTSVSLNYGSLKQAIQIGDNTLLMALNSGFIEVDFNPETKTFFKRKLLLNERSYSVAREKNTKNTYVSAASGLRYSDGESAYDLVLNGGKAIQVLNLTSYRDQILASSSQQGLIFFKNGKVVKQITPIYNEIALTVFKLIIHNDRIYANTQMGLFVMNMKGEIINVLNKSIGLIANKIIDFELFQNKLWVTHAKGIQHFELRKINLSVPRPSVALKSVYINTEKVEDIAKNGQFTSGQRDFKFSFQTSTLRYRDNIRYHFKLEGYVDNWSINTYDYHEVEYNALAPGNYRFIVKAENNGIFSNPIYYSFTISAPFYQRWWFVILIIIAAVLVVTAAYKRQLNIQQRKAQQVNELNASRLTAIQSQMNPHFIFNSLNSIQDLVLKGDIDNSYDFITKFSNLVRRTLSYSDKDFIDFEEEIKLIELYLSLEKLRFKEDLEFKIEINDIEDLMVPPMLIQPFIENALVHGLLHKKGKKRLTINFKLEEVLICEITDNGIGREKAQEIKNRQGNKHDSFAVNAIKKRFKILMSHHEGQLGFEMEDVLENELVIGTKVTLHIPVQLKF